MNRDDGVATDVGIIHGLGRYKEGVQIMLDGENKTIDNAINAFSVPDMIPQVRLGCYRVLSRRLLYLGGEFLTFNSPLSQAIRGEKCISEEVCELPVSKYDVRNHPWAKKVLYMRQFDGEEKATAKDSLREVPHGLREKYLGKGGPTSKVIEFLLSTVMGIGLEMPFRACSIASLNRELWIRQLRSHRNLWSEARTTSIFRIW